jgi:hypothetical protein
MNPIVGEFNRGFGNCYFISRDPESVSSTFMEKINETMTFNVSGVKVTPVDDLHDKLSLSLVGGENVEGVLSWRKSSTGVHYVLNGLTIQ